MRRDITRESLTAAIEELGSYSKVRERFGLNHRTFFYYMEKYGIARNPECYAAAFRVGRDGEYSVCKWLRSSGYKVERAPYDSPYDMTCNSKRIEVKSSTFDSRHWKFNIERGGVLNESAVDVYILRLEGVPGFKAAVHLILSAPIERPNIKISLRTLLAKYGQHYNKFELLNS